MFFTLPGTFLKKEVCRFTGEFLSYPGPKFNGKPKITKGGTLMSSKNFLSLKSKKTIYPPYFGPENHDFDGFRSSCPFRNFSAAYPISNGNFTLEMEYAIEKFPNG